MKIERTKLKNLTKQITDGEHGSVKDDNNSNYYLLSNKNINNGLIKYDEFDRKISKKTLEKISQRTKLQNGDVIISTVGTIGKSAIVRNKNINFDFQRSVGIIKCDNKKIIPEFLYYYFNLNQVKKRLTDNANVSIQKCLYIADLEDIIVDYYKDTSYQSKIVNLLSKLDSKINLNFQINEKIENIIKSIYNYWFVQFDFPNSKSLPYKTNGGKMVWNKFFKREIPFNWKVGTLKDVLYIVESGDRPKGRVRDNKSGIPSIGAENILSIAKYNFDQEKFVPYEYFSDMKKGIVKSNDVLLYKDGLSLGRVSMFKNDFPYKKCCVNSHVFILRSNDSISQNYLYFWLDQKYIKKLIARYGMASSQPGINQQDVNEIPILIPDNNLIKSFDELIKSNIDMLFSNSKENKILNTLKNWLLPMLMSGQLKIN